MSQDDTFRNGRLDGRVRLEVDSVGGIAEAAVTLGEGVTLVVGPNASNKSSLLRALAGALGGPRPPLKSDATEGAVRLTVDGEEHAVELVREGDDVVVTDADRYSGARTLCELFVALTETNPIRRAVVAGDDLYDLLMRPVDTAEIEAEIDRLTAEKASLDERLDDLAARADRLPGLRAKRDDLRERLADVEARLDAKRDAVAEVEAAAGADGAPAALADRRVDLAGIRDRIGTQEDAVESLTAELDEVTDRLDRLDAEGTDGEVAEIGEIEAELERLHRRKQRMTSTINALSPVVEMNAQLLDDGESVPDAMTSEEVVAELDPSTKSITCWTCGSTVERAQIAEQVEAVRAIVREKRNERDAVTERIQSLTERRRELEERRDELERLRERRNRIEEEIEEREGALADLRDERRAVEEGIADRRREVETATDADGRLSEFYDEISDLEYERGRLTTDLEAVESEIAGVEAALADRPDLETRRESVAEELRDLRDRVETVERDLVNRFNEVMRQVLDTLEYRSVERVWLERRGHDGADGTEFELHVVRVDGDGAAYDDTVGSLSKSEREVVGLVVGLAGYLVHDVDEAVPFLVVDAVEMLDADRLRGLVDRFADHADYVVATALPEEGRELAGTYDTVSTLPSPADC